MNKCRLIARIDIKSENVVKGVQYEGLRVIGKPDEIVDAYINQGCDEIFYIDTVASLYGRNNLKHIVSLAASKANVPITVEGGVNTLEDVQLLLEAGADKVAINTYAIKDPEFITQAAREFGNQCIVLSITAKKNTQGKWIAWTDNAREVTGVNAVEWARSASSLGAGELIMTSVDNDGRMKGMDIDLYQQLSDINVPLIASGGVGRSSHIAELYEEANVDGVAVASCLHYKKETIYSLRESLVGSGFSLRSFNRNAEVKDYTSTKSVHIINYNTSNMFSLVNSIKAIGVTPVVCSKPEDLEGVERIILPGVGSFGPAISLLRQSGLFDALIHQYKQGIPIMGICLGAQMLFEKGYEGGEYKGLGIVKGEVASIRKKCNESLRVPHIGWERLSIQEGSDNDYARQFLNGVDLKDEYYFLHSYVMLPVDESNLLASASYFNSNIPAIVNEKHVFGCQFHPEKSGAAGLRLLSNFCNLQ